MILQANVGVDLMAKEELQRDREVDDTSVLQGQCWRIKDDQNNEYIQGNIEKALRQVMYEERMKKMWGEKFKLERDITTQKWDLMK